MTVEYGDDFLPIDDDRADRGNDGYLKSEKRLFAAHCLQRKSLRMTSYTPQPLVSLLVKLTPRL
jgi:hypothetical protein